MMRQIPGYDGYSVTSDGRVWSDKTHRGASGRWLKPFVQSKGPLRVDLYVDGNRKAKYIHSLVALAFFGPRPEGVQKSGRVLYSIDREDNDGNYEPGNVCWSTSAEQVRNQRKVAKMTLDMAAITEERDALAAELAALKVSLATMSGLP